VRWFPVVDKLLETNESMHRLLQEKHRLLARLMKFPYQDFYSIAEVRNASCLLFVVCNKQRAVQTV